MDKALLVLVSLMLFLKLGFAQYENSAEARIDSTIQWMEDHLLEDSIRITLHKTALELAGILQKSGQKDRLARVHQFLANWHDYYNEFSLDSALYHQQKALEFYQSAGDKKMQAEAHISLSGIYINQSNFKLAEEQIFNAIDVFQSLDDQNGQGVAYRKIGQIYMITEEPEQALQYDQIALELLKATHDHYNICLTLMNMTISYNQLKEYEKALVVAGECIQILQDENMDEFGIEARIYAFRGDSYRDLEQYDAAEADYTKAWEIVRSVVGDERAIDWELDIANVLVLKGNYEAALPRLLRAVEALEENENPQSWIPFQMLINCYKGLGDYKNALHYAEKYTASRDSMYTRKIESIEAEGMIKYETGKKDEALASQAVLIQQKNKTQTLIIIIASILFLFLMSLLYFFNKNKKKTRIIHAKNAENELLLKEIHHRVKNNLEMVKSLIALQSTQIEDPVTKDAMIASQNRVQSMGIIHQKLYQGQNLGSIEMKDYFMNLGEGILDTFNAEEKVEIECAMDNLDLDVDTAVPIGLIVNELLTNALKYAFPEDKQGMINISLEKMDDNYLKLKVEDNGIGKKHGIAPEGTGFGSQLVSLLTKQLNGKMTERVDGGTRIEFDFLLDTAA